MAELIINKESLIPFLVNDDKLITYQNDLNFAARTGSEVLFDNEGIEHAAILLSTIFQNTKSELLIYGEQLRGCLTSLEPYYKSLRDCISRNVTVKILLKDQDEEGKSPMRIALEHLSEDPNSLVSVRSLPDPQETFKQNSTFLNPTHFTVADGRMVRIEYDRDKFKAFGSMNSPELAGFMRNAFYAIFKQSWPNASASNC